MGRVELHPSEAPLEDPGVVQVDRVEWHPSEVPLEDLGAMQVGRVEWHPSGVPPEDHWGVDLVALQMHRVEELMMVDLVLLEGRVGSRPLEVQRVDQEG